MSLNPFKLYIMFFIHNQKPFPKVNIFLFFKIIFQKEVKISKSDSVEDISNKVHNLELEHFPRVIELILFKV